MNKSEEANQAGAPIRILLVDDHPIVRIGLAALIGMRSDMVAVAQAGGGREAIELHRLHNPDVTLMDLRLPDLSAVEAIREIRTTSPDAKFIVLTTYEGDEDIYQALAAGAPLAGTLSRACRTTCWRRRSSEFTPEADICRKSFVRRWRTVHQVLT